MRNVFDQYSQPENRLTHALAVTLHEDRAILKSFIEWLGIAKAPEAKRLKVFEQQLPGEEIDAGRERSDEESERRGLPDISIFDEKADRPWALLVESKVQARIDVDQLKRHQSTVIRRGFRKPVILLVTVDSAPPSDALPDGAVATEWRKIYEWLRREHGKSSWSRAMTEYLEVFERKAEEYSIRGTITMFDGLRFDEEHPYNYPEAKRLLRLLGAELRARKSLTKIGVNLGGEGRGAITGSGGDLIWDFLPLRGARGGDAFTAHPHLTFLIGHERAGVQLSVPNGVKGGFRKRLEALGPDGFERLLSQIERNLRTVLKRARGSKPYVRATQRHWPSRSAAAIEDARLSFDPRTVVKGGRDGVKYQPEWARGTYQTVIEKQSNIGLGLGVSFSYADEIVRSADVVDLFVESSLALLPAIELAAPEALARR